MNDTTRSAAILGFLTLLVATVILPAYRPLASAADGSTDRSTEPRQTHASAQWIWATQTRTAGQTAYFRKTFPAKKAVRRAVLSVLAEFCDADVFVNGHHAGTVECYGLLSHYDVTRFLGPADNVLAVRAVGCDGPAAVAVWLNETTGQVTERTVTSGADWLASFHEQAGWQTNAFRADRWPRAAAFGVVRERFWDDGSANVGLSELDDYTQWKQALSHENVANPASFRVMDGFEIERLRSAQPDEGSWISLEFDPQGRLIVSREDRGLLRMTLPQDGRPLQVETVNDTLKECRGLLWAFDSLYVNANESKGFYRLRDTTGDDQFDDVRLLYEAGGKTGHGRNDLARGPDNRIYLIHGDAVELPDAGRVTGEFRDLTSPFREHSRGIRTREGFLLRTDKDGRTWELMAAGLRNPYGIAFHPDGEPFTYDADAEFDMGAPWYRPTRVNHLVAGSDFGWRGVTGKWPPYFPDHPDNALPNLDIGRGSPTGVKFGNDSHFPPKYRRALFILDWAYGRVLAVHLTPSGSSYAARAETFVRGRPLNVTDLDFGPDGAMYFVTGGRKTQSALYRVSYDGPTQTEEPTTAQQQARASHARNARRQRRALESLLGRRDAQTLDQAWPHLDSPDPRIRYTARTVVEHQEVALWQDRALAEPRTTAALTALTALARGVDAGAVSQDVGRQIVARLQAMPVSELSPGQKLSVLFVYERCVEAGGLNAEVRTSIRRQLAEWYPDEVPSRQSESINHRLARLLARLNSGQLVAKTLGRIDTATPKQRLHSLFVLRNVATGWTPELRTTYFRLLNQADSFQGGQGMPGFIKRITDEALASVPEDDRTRFAKLLAGDAENDERLPERPFVRKWTLAELSDALSDDGERDWEQGRAMFRAALCNRCHRLGGQGKPVGPDLTSVARRFSRRDILRSIVSPSDVVADQYRNVQIVTTGGKVYVGRVVPSGDFRSPNLLLSTDPLRPDKTTTIPKASIELHRTVRSSPMPDGLLNTLTRDEIRNLLTYVESGGRRP